MTQCTAEEHRQLLVLLREGHNGPVEESRKALRDLVVEKMEASFGWIEGIEKLATEDAKVGFWSGHALEPRQEKDSLYQPAPTPCSPSSRPCSWA